jgi:hypothetical protein
MSEDTKKALAKPSWPSNVKKSVTPINGKRNEGVTIARK